MSMWRSCLFASAISKTTYSGPFACTNFWQFGELVIVSFSNTVRVKRRSLWSLLKSAIAWKWERLWEKDSYLYDSNDEIWSFNDWLLIIFCAGSDLVNVVFQMTASDFSYIAVELFRRPEGFYHSYNSMPHFEIAYSQKHRDLNRSDRARLAVLFYLF